MGQITGDSIVQLKLLEPATGVLPSDFRETLADLDADGVVNSRPPVEIAGQRGFARVFDGATPTDLEVVDTAAELNLTRSMTFQASVRLNLADQDAAGVPGTIASYGFRDSAPEDLQFLVELDVVSLAARTVNVRMRWEDTTGTLEAGNAGATFVWETFEAEDRLILLTVVREWISDVEVIVRYYVDDTLIATETSTDGDIGGAAGATFFLGVRGDGAGAYENNLEGKLEAVEVFDFPMTSEEIRQIFRRFAIHEPEQTANLRKLVPERVWSTDLDSIIQREFKVEGAMLGGSASKIAELLEDFLPDRAWSFLDRWETVLGLTPGPADTVSVRRNRLLSFLRTVEGFSVDGIKNALEATFDLDATDIEILEFSNTTLDDFATGLSDYFQSIPNSHTITPAAGVVTIASVAATDHSWPFEAPHLKGVISGDVIRTLDPSEDAEINVEITASSFAADTESIAGIIYINQAQTKAVFIGLARVAGVTRIVSQTFKDGAFAAFVDHAAAPAAPFFLNAKFTGGDEYEIATATSGDRNDLTAVATISGVVDLPDMIALGVVALDGIHTGSTGIDSITFDNFRLFTPNGEAPFHWYAFRDPILPGSPDIPGANAVVRRIKPAHTTAAAVAIKALLCDDPASLCDDGPLG